MKAKTYLVRDGAMISTVIGIIAELDPEKEWDVEIRPHTKRRSLSQNNLMWKWINEVADYVAEHTGYTEKEIHSFFKDQFLTSKDVVIAGRASPSWTTTTLTTPEMYEYMERIYAWASTELGMHLTNPEDMQRNW